MNRKYSSEPNRINPSTNAPCHVLEAGVELVESLLSKMRDDDWTYESATIGRLLLQAIAIVSALRLGRLLYEMKQWLYLMIVDDSDEDLAKFMNEHRDGTHLECGQLTITHEYGDLERQLHQVLHCLQRFTFVY